MTFAELIADSRSDLEIFNYDDYPVCFAAFSQRAQPLFDALGPDPSRAAETLTDTLSEVWAALPRRERRETAQQDKQVVALFLYPAAIRHSETAAAFARALQTIWNRRFPRNKFLPGEFDAIMKGFDANLLGLPLRKSRKKKTRL